MAFSLDNLKTVERSEIAERIKIALGYGDLSENSEYDEAKSAQEANENKRIPMIRAISEGKAGRRRIKVFRMSLKNHTAMNKANGTGRRNASAATL